MLRKCRCRVIIRPLSKYLTEVAIPVTAGRPGVQVIFVRCEAHAPPAGVQMP